MANLSLREVAQSQLDQAPVIDGQLIVCTDTGSTYRDIGTRRIQISKDLEIVSSLPLAPLSNKIYYLRPDSLYVYSGDDWILLNPSKFTLEADKNAINGEVNINLILNGTAQDKIKIAGGGVTTVTTDETGDITIDTPHPDELLVALTNDEIDAITGGMVDDSGNPLPTPQVVVDATLTVSGRAADAKVTGTRISEALSIAKSADAGLTNVRTELDKLKLDSVAVDKTLTKENFAADAKAVGDALAKKANAEHNHDDRYYTEDEINVKLSKKSDDGHTHDERYYQQNEIDEKLKVKANTINIHTLTIPTTSQLTDDTVDRYSKYIDLDIDGITSKDVISISVTPASAKAASYAQFANPETFDGYVRLRAVSVPTTAITTQYYIVQGGGQTDSGSGTVVEGYTKAQVDNKIATAIKVAKEEQKLLDHPVGSIYQSIEPTSPAELFGGEWQKIEDRMLIAASNTYPVKSTGGEATHNHTQDLTVPFYIAGSGSSTSTYFAGYKTGKSWTSAYKETGLTETEDTSFTQVRGLQVLGDVNTASSMPPYYAVYTWLRTA